MNDRSDEPSKAARRQQKLRAKREAAGLKQVTVWVKAENVEKLRAYARQLETHQIYTLPSDRQLAFASDISLRTGISIPTDALRSTRRLSRWIATHRRMKSSPQWLNEQADLISRYKSLIESETSRNSISGNNHAVRSNRMIDDADVKASALKRAEEIYSEVYSSFVFLGNNPKESLREAKKQAREYLEMSGWPKPDARSFVNYVLKKPDDAQ